MKDRDLMAWIDALSPQHEHPSPPQIRKRKRTRGLQTPPPDSTSFIDTMNTPAKRTAAHVDQDQDETPRAPRSHPAGGSLPSTSSRTSQSSSRASPSKRRREVESMEKSSLSTRSFSTKQPNDLPDDLKILLRDLTQASKGRRIISPSRREEIPATEDSIEDWHFLLCDSEQDESPAFKDVRKIQRRAGRYTEASYDEAAWTAGVVFPLLELAIPDDEQLVVVPCTSARVVDRDLLPPAYASGKMVDICLAINPSWIPKSNTHTSPVDTTTYPAIKCNASSTFTATRTFGVDYNSDNGARVADALRRVQRLQPFTTINHTDYQPLSRSPIALSIEIKRPNGDSEEAQRQLAVWQYAHWNMLQLLASTKIDGRLSSLEGLSFLPGIYIVGHKWGFSATVRDEAGELVQWIDCPMGSTESAHGIYAIVWGLRRIAQYITQVYWPWFQRNMLRLVNVPG